jgi:hypothetical protein
VSKDIGLDFKLLPDIFPPTKPLRNTLYAFAFGESTFKFLNVVATLATVGVVGDVDRVDNPPDAIVAPVRRVLPINALLVRSAIIN